MNLVLVICVLAGITGLGYAVNLLLDSLFRMKYFLYGFALLVYIGLGYFLFAIVDSVRRRGE